MKKKLAVEYMEIDKIIPYERNPRIHTSKQVQQIVNSIDEYDFTVPIIVDEKNVIITGHGRLLAALKLEMKEVPVIKLTHLTDAQKRMYRIADNKLTENGKWDENFLKLEFIDLGEMELDCSLDITGFDMGEIDIMLDSSVVEKNKEPDEKLNATPFIEDAEIVSQEGDIWELGPHRILCGDSRDEKNYKTLLGKKRARLVLYDVPYNLSVASFCGSGQIQHEEFAVASGEMSEEEFIDFLIKIFELAKKFSVDGSLHFIFIDWRHVKEMSIAGAKIYDELKNICVWVKSNGGMGSLYRSQHELIFVFKNGTAPHINNIELGKHGRYRTNVWQYAGVNSFGKEQDNLKLHPTVKPVEMIKDAILDVTKQKDIVLDAFLGSGTTLIAAEESSRICYGIEIEKKFIDTAIRRWQEITGKEAIHMQSGKTYNALLIHKQKKETQNDK